MNVARAILPITRLRKILNPKQNPSDRALSENILEFCFIEKRVMGCVGLL